MYRFFSPVCVILFIASVLVSCSDDSDAPVFLLPGFGEFSLDDPASATDITDAILSSRSANCADYVDSYTATVTDVQRSREFTSDVLVEVDSGSCIISSDAIPNHDFNDGPAPFVNDVLEQNQMLEITASPAFAPETTSLVVGQKQAVMLNGVVVDLLSAGCYGVADGKVGCFDPETPWRYDPASPFNDFGTDTHNAHAQPDGTYHYHGSPNALFDMELSSEQSPVIGFAADGFPVFGPYINDNGTIRNVTSSYQLKEGKRPDGEGEPGGDYDGTFIDDYEYIKGSGDLDECNGMSWQGVYGYYLTDGYPYVVGCFKGTRDSSFNF